MTFRRCEQETPEIPQTGSGNSEPEAKTGKQASWEAAFEAARQNAKTFRVEPDTEAKSRPQEEAPKTERPEQGGQPHLQEQPQPEPKPRTEGRSENRTQRRSASEAEKNRREEVPAQDWEDRLGTLSLVFGILSVASVVYPYVTIPLACAAAACGFIGRKSAKKNSAKAGLVIGVIMILFGFVLLICLSALSPYMEELTDAFTAYMQSAQ